MRKKLYVILFVIMCNLILGLVSLTAQELPSDVQTQALPLPTVAEANNVPKRVTGYKLPWPAGQRYMATGVRTSHTSYGAPRQSIDFGVPLNVPILAMKSGDIVLSQNIGGATNGYVIIDHNDGYCSVYVHLSSLQFGTITSGRRAVKRGEKIGMSGRLGTTGAIHLHVAVYSRAGSNCGFYNNNDKTREQAIIFDEVGRELNYGDWVTSQNTASRDNIPANQNVIRNGTFSEGFSHWQTYDNIAYAIYDGVLAFKRANDSKNGAVLQHTNYDIPEGTPIEITFLAGNNSNVVKELIASFRNMSTWDGVIMCTFTSPPKTGLQNYIIRGRTTHGNWSNALIEFAPNPPDGIPDVLLDNVSVVYKTSINPTKTECISPIEAVAVTNAGFETPGTDKKVPDGWKVKNATKDQRKCNKVEKEKIVARTGDCAFQFTGNAGSTAKLTQSLTPPTALNTDTLKLKQWVSTKKLSSGGLIKLVAKYADGTKDTLKLTVPQGTNAYAELSGKLTLKGAISKLKYSASMKNGSGKYFIDDVRVSLEKVAPRFGQSNELEALLPLPAVASQEQ